MSQLIKTKHEVETMDEIQYMYEKLPLRTCYSYEVKYGYKMDRMIERIVYEGHRPDEFEVDEYIDKYFPKNSRLFFKLLDIEELRYKRYGEKLLLDKVIEKLRELL